MKGHTMTDSITAATVNRDGFTENDVAARRAVLNGTPFPHDRLAWLVREAYRTGLPVYRLGLGVKNRRIERREIEDFLKETFPTSHISCEYDEKYHLGLHIVVTFPQ